VKLSTMSGSKSMLRTAMAALRQGMGQTPLVPGLAAKGALCSSECLVRRYSSESSDYDRMPDSSKKPDSGEIVVEIPVKFNLHLLESGPPQEAITTKEELMKSYRDMSIIRRTEITADMVCSPSLPSLFPNSERVVDPKW
jgi:hypothetical protein